jgi:hypothetical protein
MPPPPGSIFLSTPSCFLQSTSEHPAASRPWFLPQPHCTSGLLGSALLSSSKQKSPVGTPNGLIHLQEASVLTKWTRKPNVLGGKEVVLRGSEAGRAGHGHEGRHRALCPSPTTGLMFPSESLIENARTNDRRPALLSQCSTLPRGAKERRSVRSQRNKGHMLTFRSHAHLLRSQQRPFSTEQSRAGIHFHHRLSDRDSPS